MNLQILSDFEKEIKQKKPRLFINFSPKVVLNDFTVGVLFKSCGTTFLSSLFIFSHKSFLNPPRVSVPHQFFSQEFVSHIIYLFSCLLLIWSQFGKKICVDALFLDYFTNFITTIIVWWCKCHFFSNQISLHYIALAQNNRVNFIFKPKQHILSSISKLLTPAGTTRLIMW